MLGYAATRALISALALPETWGVLALPVFGVVSVAGLASFVSGALGRTNASE